MYFSFIIGAQVNPPKKTFLKMYEMDERRLGIFYLIKKLRYNGLTHATDRVLLWLLLIAWTGHCYQLNEVLTLFGVFNLLLIFVCIFF